MLITTCSRADCHHDKASHFKDEDGQYGACLVMRCDCNGYKDPHKKDPPRPSPPTNTVSLEEEDDIDDIEDDFDSWIGIFI